MTQPADAPSRTAVSRHKLWSVTAIIYGTLALLFISMPGQLVSRLDDFPPTAVVRGIQKGAMAVAAGTDRVGIGPIYRNLRMRFLTAVGIGGG